MEHCKNNVPHREHHLRQNPSHAWLRLANALNGTFTENLVNRKLNDQYLPLISKAIDRQDRLRGK